MRLIRLVLLFSGACSLACLAYPVIHDERAQLACGVVMVATLLALFFVTFEAGWRIWPASFFGAAIGVLALAQVRQVGIVGWFVACGVFMLLCSVAITPRMRESRRELRAAGSRLVAAIAERQRRTTD